MTVLIAILGCGYMCGMLKENDESRVRLLLKIIASNSNRVGDGINRDSISSSHLPSNLIKNIMD